jgi:hypothetical protein
VLVGLKAGARVRRSWLSLAASPRNCSASVRQARWRSRQSDVALARRPPAG